MMQPLRPGEAISPRFRLTTRLGEGGMGEVWSAWDNELQEEVAIKVISAGLSARADILELLRRECRNTRRLVHPNIVRVYDFHRAGEWAFISMELIQGQSLAHYKGTAPRDVLSMLIPVMEALEYAHSLGIAHRDVKASNIIVDRAGMPRLVDFGIAAVLNPQSDQGALKTGGSPRSMSPQQRAGEQPQPTDDVYACGVLLSELIYGHLPSPGTDNAVTDTAQPEGLRRIVMRMMAWEASDRPESMQAAMAELAVFAGGDPNVTRPPLVEPSEELIVPRPREASGPIRESDFPGPPPPRRQQLPARLIVPAFVLLLAAIVGVFLLLPHYVSERRDGVAAPEPPTTIPPPSGEATAADRVQPAQVQAVSPPAPAPATAAEKQAAEEALGDYLQVQVKLEEQAAPAWAPEAYAAATARASQGDEAFKTDSFVAAEGHYREATDLLKQLSSKAEDALHVFLARGEQALENGDGKTAREAFQVAAAIEPDNAQAAKGLHRAQSVEQVHALITAGEGHEAQGRLAFAHADFTAALEVDPLASRAAGGRQRVRQRIADERFQEIMSQGLAALEGRDYQRALATFREAEGLRPKSPAVADGVSRASEGIRRARLASLRRQAEKLETRERWADAAARYDSALAIDKTLVFAQQGKQRALARAEIVAKLDYYLANPELLGSRRVRENVLTFIGKAGAIEPKGPELERRVTALKERVLLATRPLEVDLRSDGETEVVVYRLGSLGRFTSRRLSLRPGTYTIVGSRPGYKDVRRQITLAAGQKLPPVYVACEEPI